MAQQHKAQKQPQDRYSQRGKTLASAVQRLRGWVGSDPARTPELADALVELTAHRLRGHGYGAAAADAQEAVRLAAQLLAENGPIGPYTSVTDAARCVTAVVHMAAVQAGVGVPEAAGRTIASLQDMREQLRELRLDEQLLPQTAIWALSCKARAALAAGNVSAANAYADAALARLTESGLATSGLDDPNVGYLAVDVDRLVSDCRWAAGNDQEALTHLHSAKDRYDAVTAARLREPGRLSPAVAERFAEPLFGLYRDMADRLAATGEDDLALATRRAQVELLQGVAKRLGDPARIQLALALADLADDLLASNRNDEAAAAADDAAALVLEWAGAGSARLMVAAVRARALTRLGESSAAVTMLRRFLPAEEDKATSAAHAVGLAALAEALRADGDIESAASTEAAFTELSRGLVETGDGVPGGRPSIRDLARGVVSRRAGTVRWAPLDLADSYASTTSAAGSPKVDGAAAEAALQRETAAWLEAERAEAHRLEVERLEQARVESRRREAERAEAQRAAAEQLAAQRAEAERAEQLEAERRAAAEEAERIERKRRREERLEAHRLEAERLEAERLEAERLAAGEAAAPDEPDELEAERLEAERVSAERLEQERLATEVDQTPAQPEAELIEGDEQEEYQPEQEEYQPEQEEHQPEPKEQKIEPEEQKIEPEEQKIPPDELTVVNQLWREAQANRDRRGARAANERVVELLRPRAATSLAEFGPQLQQALEELASARLRSGDVFGSRACAKEARALAKTLGR
jgi:hypothetical protein